MGADEESFDGRKVKIGSEVGSLEIYGFDNRIESIQTLGDCRWLAYRAPNFEVYTYIWVPTNIIKTHHHGVDVPMKYPLLDLSLLVAHQQ